MRFNVFRSFKGFRLGYYRHIGNNDTIHFYCSMTIDDGRRTKSISENCLAMYRVDYILHFCCDPKDVSTAVFEYKEVLDSCKA